jgi:hypothetical protein
MSHFYNKQGQLIDTIQGKNGKPRKTNIKDARELNLLPSVTELLKIFSRPAIEKWKVTEALKYSVDNPKMDQESIETYLSRVIPACYEKSSIAKDFGSLMHFQIECYLKNTPCPIPPEIEKFWPHVLEYITANGFCGEAEKVIVDSEVGFAGTCDFDGKAFNIDDVCVDFKTQSTLDKNNKPKKIVFYDEWAFQLAGYTLRNNKTCINMVISSDEPGKIEHKIWDNDAIVRGKLIFKRLCEIYSLTKNLPFSWWSYEIERLGEGDESDV